MLIWGTVLVGCTFHSQLDFEDDNVIEELIEDFLEHNTGWSMDFTPKN